MFFGLRVSIFTKLLLVILPLIVLPTALVGFYSIKAATKRVNRLVRQEQMVKVEAAANLINEAFLNCRVDLKTMTSLPVLEDFLLAKEFRLHAEAQFNRENLLRLWKDLLERTPHYFQIRFINKQGHELIKVNQLNDDQLLLVSLPEKLTDQSLHKKQSSFSKITNSQQRKGFLIRCARPVYIGWRELAGYLVIDLDFEKIIQIVRNTQVGKKGYSFLVDQKGRTLIHPRFAPYEYNLKTYEDPSLLSLVKEMMAGHRGWSNYSFQGQMKLAAMAPIKTMNWSLAVTIPLEEMGHEALAIKNKVIQVVALTLFIAVVGVLMLSYHLVKPIYRLASASNRIAEGEPFYKIPVASKDEIGDLTKAFNHMTENLAQTQAKLVQSEKLAGLGRLSAGVAHEIRNPLNAIKGAMTHISQRYKNEDLIKEYTGLVLEEIERLNRLATEFLYFARQAPPQKRQTDLNRLITKVQNLLTQQPGFERFNLQNNLDSALPLVRLDAGQMEQVLLNLYINAFEANPLNSLITTNTKVDFIDKQGLLVLEIINQKNAIPIEHLSNVFDPFFSTKEKGTGLGLPLSLGIIQAHGGILTLENLKSGEVKATIKIPV